MRVTTMLFNPPGRGECITKHFTMTDAAMPTEPAEFALRSVRAMKHSWPSCTTGKALSLRVCTGRNVVEGQHWMVEWALDAHINDITGFIEKHLSGASTMADLLKAAASIQPTKELSL